MSSDEATQHNGENKMKKETTAVEEMGKRYAEGWHNVISKIKVEKVGDDFFYRGWKIYPEMPEGYYEDKNTGRPLSRTVFIINGNPLFGGKRALLYVKESQVIEKTKCLVM